MQSASVILINSAESNDDKNSEIPSKVIESETSPLKSSPDMAGSSSGDTLGPTERPSRPESIAALSEDNLIMVEEEDAEKSIEPVYKMNNGEDIIKADKKLNPSPEDEYKQRLNEAVATLERTRALVSHKDVIIRNKHNENDTLRKRFRDISARQKEAFLKLRNRAQEMHTRNVQLRKQNEALKNRNAKLENVMRDFEAFKKGAEEREAALHKTIEASTKDNRTTKEELEAQREAIDDVMKRERVRSSLRVSISYRPALANGVKLTAEIPNLREGIDAVMFQWYRSVYAEWVPIQGAVSRNYVTNADDVGSMIKVEVRSTKFEDITDSGTTKEPVDIDLRLRHHIEDTLRRCLEGKETCEYPVVPVGDKVNLGQKLFLNREKIKIRMSKSNKTISKELWNPALKVELHPTNEVQFALTLKSAAPPMHFYTNNPHKRDMIALCLRAFNSFVQLNQKDKAIGRSKMLKFLIEESTLMAKLQCKQLTTIEENQPTLTRNALLINRLAPHSSKGLGDRDIYSSGYCIKQSPGSNSNSIESPHDEELLPTDTQINNLFSNDMLGRNSVRHSNANEPVVPPLDEDEKFETYDQDDRDVNEVFKDFEVGQRLDEGSLESDEEAAEADKCIVLKDLNIREVSNVTVASDADLQKFTFTPAPSSTNKRNRKVKKKRKKKKKKQRSEELSDDLASLPKSNDASPPFSRSNSRKESFSSQPTAPSNRTGGLFKQQPILFSIVELMHCSFNGTSVSSMSANGNVSVRYPKNTPKDKIFKINCRNLKNLEKFKVNSERVSIKDDIFYITPPPDSDTCWILKFEVSEQQIHGKCPLMVQIRCKPESEERSNVAIRYKVNPKLKNPLSKCSFMISVKAGENGKVVHQASKPTANWSQEVGKLMWSKEELVPGETEILKADFTHPKAELEAPQSRFRAGPLEMNWEIPEYLLSSLDFTSDPETHLKVQKKLKSGRYSSST